MNGAAGRTRIAIALGLALILGSLPQLPHGHPEADSSVRKAAAPLEPTLSGSVALEEDAGCPLCVLQRLLSQTLASSSNALEKPAVAGTFTLAATPSPADRVPWSGSPRGPPPSA